MMLMFLHCSVEIPTSMAELSRVEVERFVTHYRGLVTVNIQSNIIFGTVLVPFTKLGLITIFIVCFFACARIYQDLDTISLLLVSTVLLSSMLILVPISVIMSYLYDISKEFSRNLSSKVNVTNKRIKKMLKLQLKSCYAIRCNVGSLYYMESKAKLTMLHQMVNGVVFLMTNAKK